MTKKAFLKSKHFKVVFPLVVVALIISLWRNGYEFGQWLYRLLH